MADIVRTDSIVVFGCETDSEGLSGNRVFTRLEIFVVKFRFKKIPELNLRKI